MTRERLLSHIAPRKRCAYCYQPFVAGHHRQVYCSQECYKKSHYIGVGWRIDHGFSPNGATEKAAKTAERVTPRMAQSHVYVDRGTRYYAVDANALLELDSEVHTGRPGMPYV